uniref:NADH-ubiquinone oxidoreductase chain 2 n=1 Tax=Amphiura sp. JN-2020 TaxID=2763518 RepID=A0A7H0R1L9_9ECHI|nr:NADH dehydrogenase subunit 2 [Amphiura sp. JN-2020]
MLALWVALYSSSWILMWSLIELVTILMISLMSSHLSPRVVESMAKYYIIQAVASAVLLLGILSRYYLSGLTSIFSFYEGFSYGLILIGLFIKIAVFPNPFWFVDVISGVGLLRGFYIIVVSKLLPIYLYMSITTSINFFILLGGLGAVTFGSILGLNQTNVRKLVALSSVAHLGWLIVGFPSLSLSSCIFVLLSYFLMVFPVLWISGSYEVEDLSNMSRCYFHPWLLLVLILSLLSLGGLPPLLGFIYKWIIFVGLVKANAYMVGGYLILMSLISLFFYLRLCYLLYSTYWPEAKVTLVGSYAWPISEVPLVWGLTVVMAVSLGVAIFCLAPINVF